MESGYQPVTGTYRFAALGKALAMGEETRLRAAPRRQGDSDLLLGASMMGAHVTDVIHEVAVAVQNGLTVRPVGRHHPRPPHHRRGGHGSRARRPRRVGARGAMMEMPQDGLSSI